MSFKVRFLILRPDLMVHNQFVSDIFSNDARLFADKIAPELSPVPKIEGVLGIRVYPAFYSQEEKYAIPLLQDCYGNQLGFAKIGIAADILREMNKQYTVLAADALVALSLDGLLPFVCPYYE